MKVSIAMTTFNGALHLRQQLDSFLAQVRQPDELVVCDDVSHDETLQILRQFKQEAPFAVHIHVNASNLGFTANFSNAMQRCSGDIVFLSDQDDVWEPHKISRVLEGFYAHPDVVLTVHDGKLVDGALRWYGVTKLEQVVSGFDGHDSLVMGALTAYRRELGVIALPIPPGITGHDQWLHLIARLVGKRLVIKDVLQLIRRHGSNTSGWIASSPNRISWWDAFKSQWRTPVARSYSDRLLINASAREVLQRVSTDKAYSFDPARLQDGLDFLANERQALIARHALATQGWIQRKSHALRLLLTGGYRHFNGYKSFLRDIAR